MNASVIDEFADADRGTARAYDLQDFVETARIILSGESQQIASAAFPALIIAQAIMRSADACTARLERVADSLDDLADELDARRMAPIVAPDELPSSALLDQWRDALRFNIGQDGCASFDQLPDPRHFPGSLPASPTLAEVDPELELAAVLTLGFMKLHRPWPSPAVPDAEDSWLVEMKAALAVYCRRYGGNMRVTDRTGWHDCSDGAAAFVLPAQAFGNGAEEWLFQTEAPGSHAFGVRGSLAGWREEVAARCVGNSRLVFSVCMAFASPLLHVAGAESGGFHLRSGSSDGKTTCLRVGASVCGGSDYMQRWRATDNGLEGVALRHCDAPLFLDEISQMAAGVVGEAAYMLANGEGKSRSGKDAGLRAKPRWRLLFLSAGEVGLAQHMGEAGKQTKAGQELRLAEIPADAGAGLGAFENLHDAANGSEFAKALARAISRHYGTPWLAFVQRLAVERDALADELRAACKSFESKLLTDAAAGQARRVATRFALVGAAGELATEWGITGWQQGEAMKAAGACFTAWLSNWGGEGKHEEREALSQVRTFLLRYAESAFTDWDRPAVADNHAPVRSDRVGFRRCEKSGTEGAEVEYLVFNDVWRERVCKGLDPVFVGKVMLDRGFVKKAERGYHGKVRTPEGAHRMVCILPHFLGTEV